MTIYHVRLIYTDINGTPCIKRIETDRLEFRDGALLFFYLDEEEGYKISKAIAAGQWIEVSKQ